MKYLLIRGRINTVTQGVIEEGSILVEDGRIKEIGESLEAGDAEVIDLEGAEVFPGFIDAHSHLGLRETAIGQEGMDHNERVDPITPNMRIIDGINPRDRTLEEAYEAGVTTVMISPGSANVICGTTALIKTYGHRIDHMIVREPAGMKIAFGENPKRVHKGQNQSPATRMAIAGLLRETLFKARAYMEKKEGGEDVAFDMKMEALIPVLKREIPLKAHAHRADDIFTALRIAREFDLDISLDHCTEGHLIAEDLAQEGRPAIVGPSFGHRTKFELREKSFATAQVLSEAGVKIALTTDSPVIPLHHLPLCAGLAIREGLAYEEALRAITINPAEIMGVDARIGSLEVGKDADLVAYRGNPLRDIAAQAILTMIDGKLVYTRI